MIIIRRSIALAVLTAALAGAAPASAANLYDQYDNLAPGVVSSFDESALGQSPADNEAADDVAVPLDERWKVKSVEVAGSYFLGSGPASNVNVAVYKNSHGLPGAQVYRAASIVPTSLSDPNFVAPLPTAAKLRAGKRYWVSVQANIGAAKGRWGWSSRAVQSGFESAWRNPGDGFGTGCTTFQPVSSCGISGGPDLMFRLRGKAIPVAS